MLDEISKAIQERKENDILPLIEEALDLDFTAKEILNDGMVAGMGVVGERFKKGKVFIPEVMLSAQTMNKGLERLEPLLAKEKVESKGKVLIGTVKDDRHDIGKNIVSIMLKGAGFDIIDLGTNVSTEEFIEKSFEEEPDFVLLSALLTTTMSNMKQTVQELQEEGVEATIMVGGAPVTQEFADSINAEFAENAAETVEKVNDIVGQK